jgi:hypothetical protein
VTRRRASERAGSPSRRGERPIRPEHSLNGCSVSGLMGRLGASETAAGVLLAFFRRRCRSILKPARTRQGRW